MFILSVSKEWYLTKYTFFLDEIIIQPLTKAAEEDHPLNPNPNSQWQSFFKDNEVLLQVNILINSIEHSTSFWLIWFQFVTISGLILYYSQRCLLVGRQRCSKTLSRNFILFSTNRTPKRKNSIWWQWKATSTCPPNYIKFTESRTQRNGRTKGKKGQIRLKGHYAMTKYFRQ